MKDIASSVSSGLQWDASVAYGPSQLGLFPGGAIPARWPLRRARCARCCASGLGALGFGAATMSQGTRCEQGCSILISEARSWVSWGWTWKTFASLCISWISESWNWVISNSSVKLVMTDSEIISAQAWQSPHPMYQLMTLSISKSSMTAKTWPMTYSSEKASEQGVASDDSRRSSDQWTLSTVLFFQALVPRRKCLGSAWSRVRTLRATRSRLFVCVLVKNSELRTHLGEVEIRCL